MEEKNKSGFAYTYSAQEQEELRRIRAKYTPKTETEDKMARLRRLDASVTQTAQAVALVFGVLGALLLGLGMSLIMSELGELLGMRHAVALVVGISVGAVGGALVSVAFPIYNSILQKKRKSIAPEILRLADELLK